MEISQPANEKGGDNDVHVQFIKSQLAAVDLTLDQAVKGRQLEHKERRALWARRMRKCMNGKYVYQNSVNKESSDDEVKPIKGRVMGLSSKRMSLLEEIESESPGSGDSAAIELSPRMIERKEKLRQKDLRRRREANAERHPAVLKLGASENEKVRCRDLNPLFKPTTTIMDLTRDISAHSADTISWMHEPREVSPAKAVVHELNESRKNSGQTRDLSQPWLWA